MRLSQSQSLRCSCCPALRTGPSRGWKSCGAGPAGLFVTPPSLLTGAHLRPRAGRRQKPSWRGSQTSQSRPSMTSCPTSVRPARPLSHKRLLCYSRNRYHAWRRWRAPQDSADRGTGAAPRGAITAAVNFSRGGTVRPAVRLVNGRPGGPNARKPLSPPPRCPLQRRICTAHWGAQRAGDAL